MLVFPQVGVVVGLVQVDVEGRRGRGDPLCNESAVRRTWHL